MINGQGLTAVEPEGSRDIRDANGERREAGGCVGGDELEARVDLRLARRGELRAGRVERRLGDSVVLRGEDELQVITSGDTGELFRRERQGTVVSNNDLVGRLCDSDTNGDESSGEGRETHREYEWIKDRYAQRLRLAA